MKGESVLITENSPLNRDYYYVRDAQGNILAIYERRKEGNFWKYNLKEISLYGSSRLGVWNGNILIKTEPCQCIKCLKNNTNAQYAATNYTNKDTLRAIRMTGLKQYELANHLGNVLVTITDRKEPASKQLAGSSGSVQLVGSYRAVVRSAGDYYAGGMALVGRSYNSDKYRFGHNTQEKTDEISGIGNHYTAEYWEYSPRIVRRWNMDPKPNPSLSFYNCYMGNPIWFSDVLGDTTDFYNKEGKFLFHIEDKSNAKFKLTGDDRSKEYFKFDGFDENKKNDEFDGKIILKSVIKGAQLYTRENYLNDGKYTYCDWAAKNVAGSFKSAAESMGLKVTGGIEKLLNAGTGAKAIYDAMQSNQNLENEDDAVKGAKSENTLSITTISRHVITYTPDGLYSNVGGSKGNSVQEFLWMKTQPGVKFYMFQTLKK